MLSRKKFSFLNKSWKILMAGSSQVGNGEIRGPPLESIGKNFLADAINDLLAKIQDTLILGVPWIASYQI